MATIYVSITKDAGTNAGTCAGDLSAYTDSFTDNCLDSETIEGGGSGQGYASDNTSCPGNGTPGCSSASSPCSNCGTYYSCNATTAGINGTKTCNYTYTDPNPDTCDDATACNFGSVGDCTFPPANYDCDGNCIGVTCWDGSCVASSTDCPEEEEPCECGSWGSWSSWTDLGCGSGCDCDEMRQRRTRTRNCPNACDYQTDYDYQCISDASCVCSGCTDPSACNYDSDNTVDDGSPVHM